MIPLSAHELRYLGQAETTPEDEIRRAEHVKKVHAWLRSHFPEDQKDAPIIRVHVDGKYDPNKDVLWPIPDAERNAIPDMPQNDGY